jgi:hypothetical protein
VPSSWHRRRQCAEVFLKVAHGSSACRRLAGLLLVCEHTEVSTHLSPAEVADPPPLPVWWPCSGMLCHATVAEVVPRGLDQDVVHWIG